jgi:hypothetical protein
MWDVALLWAYNIDFHISLLRPWSEHLEGCWLPGIEMTDCLSYEFALLCSSFVAGQFGRGWGGDDFWGSVAGILDCRVAGGTSGRYG